jgi:hypothetical protein
MPGLVPGIHVFAAAKVVDGRDKPGHDEFLILLAVLEPNRGSRVKRLSIFRRTFKLHLVPNLRG